MHARPKEVPLRTTAGAFAEEPEHDADRPVRPAGLTGRWAGIRPV
jgi:hypothetical protein